jgi:hypothetical protein
MSLLWSTPAVHKKGPLLSCALPKKTHSLHNFVNVPAAQNNKIPPSNEVKWFFSVLFWSYFLPVALYMVVHDLEHMVELLSAS